MGIFMLLKYSKSKQQLLVALFLLLLASCKQSEFYEKSGLSEVAKDKESGTVVDPGTVKPPVAEPPIVVNPPVVNPPVVNPPVVVVPPVVTPPVVSPPVVVVPPVVTPPVVTPPVVTPPVVVVPPVVTPPVVTPPVVVVPPVKAPPTPLPPATPPATKLVSKVETFTQDTSKDGAVDILWIIDDSGSMGNEQDALAANFKSFIDQFITKDIDFKMAITTTDASSTKNGKMVGDSSMLTRASAKGNQSAFMNNFTKFVKVGTKGSGVEQGLRTSVSFSDRYASSFLRPDAYLAIVYISDEEDQSPLKVSEYLAKLQALKANKAMVKAYSIITVKDYGFQDETIGKRYEEVSKATGGTVGDIKQNFAPMLLDMGRRIVNLVDSFALVGTPYQNSVEVYVSGIKIETGFTYDAVSRSIKFNADALPAEGSEIQIKYKVQEVVTNTATGAP